MSLDKLRRNLALAASALLVAVAGVCWATTIEGYTPAGNFQTVFVSADGRLFVEIDSTTPQHVITDTGSVVSILGTVPVNIVSPNPLPVSATFSGVINVASSTGATLGTGQLTLSNVAQQVYAASATRLQSTVCNNDSLMMAWVGPSGVTTTTGLALPPGTCYFPDVPASFQGALLIISTGTGTSGDISYATVSP